MNILVELINTIIILLIAAGGFYMGYWYRGLKEQGEVR